MLSPLRNECFKPFSLVHNSSAKCNVHIDLPSGLSMTKVPVHADLNFCNTSVCLRVCRFLHKYILIVG